MKYMSHALTRGDFMYYGSFFVSKTCIFECNTTSDWLNRMVVLPVHSNTAKYRQILENKTKNIVRMVGCRLTHGQYFSQMHQVPFSQGMAHIQNIFSKILAQKTCT